MKNFQLEYDKTMIWISEKNKIPKLALVKQSKAYLKIRHKNKDPQNNIQISTAQGASRNLKVYIFVNDDYFVQANFGS